MWLDLPRSLLERTDDASARNCAAVHLAQEVREAGAIFPLDVFTEREQLEMIVVKAVAYECPWSRVSVWAERVAAELVIGRIAELAPFESSPLRRNSVSEEMGKGSRQRNVRILDDEDELHAFRRHMAPTQRRRNILANPAAGKLTWDWRAIRKIRARKLQCFRNAFEGRPIVCQLLLARADSI